MIGVPKKPEQGKLENVCNRVKMKREFIRICCIQLKLLNAIKCKNVESRVRYENK